MGRNARAVGRELADGGRAENIGHISKFRPVPGVEKRAGAGQALRLAHTQGLVGRDVNGILHDGVRPSDAHHVEFRKLPGIDEHRAAPSQNLPVEIPGFHLHHRADALRITLRAIELDFQPMRWRA